MTTYTFTGPKTRRQHRGTCPSCGKKVTRTRVFEHTVNPWNKRADGTPKTWDEVAVDVRAIADSWVPNFQCQACDDATDLARAGADELRRWIRQEAHHRDHECDGEPTRRALSNERLATYAAKLADLDPTLGNVITWTRGGVYRCYFEFPDGSRCIYGTRHGSGQHLSPLSQWAPVSPAVAAR